MARDPFAICPDLAEHDPGFRLPPPEEWDLGLLNFKVWDRQFGARRIIKGFSVPWCHYMGGPAAVARYVRAAFEGTLTEDKAIALLAATVRAWGHDDLMATYPLAFGVEAKAAKLAAALAQGAPHPTDAIFAAHLEDAYARGLASAVKAHLASGDSNHIPRDLRWPLLMLLQGYHRHHRRQLPLLALYAVAAVLGLLDEGGHGKEGVRLAGVTRRRAFIERAAEVAFGEAEDGFEFQPLEVPAEERAERLFEEHPIFEVAVNLILVHGFGDEPREPDDDTD